jgi:hypothetical protein
VFGDDQHDLAGLVELNLMHTRTRAQCCGRKKREKKGKLSHVCGQPDSFVRLREASKVYCRIIETRSVVGMQVHYFCTSK